MGKTYGGLTGKKGEDFSKENSPNLKPYIPYTNILNQTYISKNHFDYVSIDEGEKQNLAKILKQLQTLQKIKKTKDQK